MKKKIFVMGKVYYLAKQEICEIENEIQTDLDKFSSGGIRFKIDITSEKTLELIFTGNIGTEKLIGLIMIQRQFTALTQRS